MRPLGKPLDHFQFCWGLGQDGKEMPQDNLKMVPKLCQDGTKMIQDGAKRGRDDAKMARDAAKITQEGSSWPQDGSNMAQDDAKPKMAPRLSGLA